MKYSMQKTAQVAALSSVLLVTACGPNPQVDSANKVNNGEAKEQTLIKDKEVGAEVAHVREVDAVRVEEMIYWESADAFSEGEQRMIASVKRSLFADTKAMKKIRNRNSE